ncbi:hypothetical protein OHU11_29960 [Streptomyces sp. NBC_00257]|uniref:hypothetical protein n=1 Tax=unclassified Streptomyces TaxID=2593676 RepID=UPI002259011B|nr:MULTISPECIES: hypothetical protein [unclassified Streptomyces]MCX5431877.1 hypothetical protein [Streptomyces sp. NBC_00062]
MTDTTEAPEAEDERPFRVRDIFQFRRPAALETDEEPTAEEAPPEAPPMPIAPPTIPAARVGRAARTDDHHVPNWWDADKTQLTSPRPAADGVKWINGVPHHVPAPVPQPAAEQTAEAEPKRASAEDKCLHLSLLSLRDEADKGDGEVVARLCLDCNLRLPATDPEPKPDCEHEQRLEARSESGKLIGYVCAAAGCGARLSVEEVHGRAGKWLRSTGRYYPRIPNPLSPKVAEGGEVKPALSPGTLRLLANAGAAGAGYRLGLVPLIGHAIEECGRTTSIGGALTLGGGVVLVVAHVWDRKTRHWHPITAWVARIPLASAITALALYAPASQI